MEKRTIIIAGAGISGLSAALALAQYDFKIIVIERNGKIQEFGAGLQIGPNAQRALNKIGVEKELKNIAFEPQGLDIYSFGSAKPLITLKLGETARRRFGVPYSVFHRADLVNALYNVAKKNKSIDIIFKVQDFEIDEISSQNGENLSVEIKRNGKSERFLCYAFIGADGVGSITRTKFLSGPQAKYSGYVAWRSLVDYDELKNIFNLNNSSIIWGAGFHAVVYPLAHRSLVNVAFFTKEAMSIGFGIRQTPNLPIFAKNDIRLAKICDMQNEWTHWPLAAVTTNIWHKGAIGLIGDAAHAMLPFQAQGAAMGIEDAIILASLLAREETPKTAFEIYEKKRQARVEKVVKTSKMNAKIFHMPKPFSIARNMVVKAQGSLNHFSRLSWLYDYDPTKL